MGADENHRPHPSAHIPPAPCSDGFPVHVEHSPKHPLAGGDGEQVDNPSSYQIAGRVLLAASGAFSGILLALVVLHLCNRGRRGGHSRDSRSRRERRLLRSLAIGAGDDDRDGGAAPSPRGLDPAVLRELPVVVAVAGAAPGDCAVCLAEFEAGEKARALPRCGHRFHVECIDAWFRENSTCPLCRADVEAPDAAAIAQPEVRIDITGDAPAVAAAAAKGGAPAMGRLPSGTDLEKTRRVFASTRSASFRI